MVLDWFGKSKESSIQAHIARKSYGKAIELLKAELQKRRNDRTLLMRLADVLVLANKPKEAVEILATLADDLALKGQAAQAIAALKRIQTIAPGREEVEEKLAYLIKQQSAPAPDPWAQKKRGADDSMIEIGLEMAPVNVDEPRATGAEWQVSGPDGAAAPELGMEDVGDASFADGAITDEAARDELVALIESALTVPTGAEHVAARVDDAVVQTPLFRDFSSEELLAVIRGLKLVVYEPGEIVVSEGEPGDSMFVLTTGGVRAFVRNAAGHAVQVRLLREGDFFGEVSILSGKPRSATITASSRSELLELDRRTLDEISLKHPRVWNVLKEFHDQRVGTTVEAAIRSAGPA
jgi:hypothetical protein